MGSGHAGTAHLLIIVLRRSVLIIPANGTGDHFLPRRDQVRFHAAVAGRTLGREIGDPIAVRRSFVNRSHGYGGFGVPWIFDRESDVNRDFLTVGVARAAITGVAGRDDNGDSGIDGAAHLFTERAVPAAVPFGVERIPETQVRAIDLHAT